MNRERGEYIYIYPRSQKRCNLRVKIQIVAFCFILEKSVESQ